MDLRKYYQFYLLLTLSLIIYSNVFSQVPLNDSTKNKVGFSIGYGDQQIDLMGVDLKVDYTYEIFFSQFNYIYSFFINKLWDISFNFQTEYGITYYKPNKNFMANTRSHEFGISSGIIMAYKLMREILSIYLLFSLGPHYSKKSPERQISGFMFNTNYNVGINLWMNDNILFDIKTGLRHLSNASLKNPNGGINNWIISFGLIYQLEK